MKKQSAGILLYRLKEKSPEIFLVHPGGPYWAGKDSGAWSIPKGEFGDGEEPLHAAQRELAEETGIKVSGNVIELTPVISKSGKKIYAWAMAGDRVSEQVKSNDFEIEWPPGTGRRQRFPEIDKAGWFDLPTARQKINVSQAAFIDELSSLLHLK